MIQTDVRYRYEAAEEVVVRLADVAVFDIVAERETPPAMLPSWTIGVVVRRTELVGEPAYLLSLLVAEERCLCVAPERAIDGTA